MSEIDTSKYSVDQIRQIIMRDFGLSEEEVNEVKGKANIVNLWKSLMQTVEEKTENDIGSILDEAEIEIHTEEIEYEQEMNRSSVGWSAYVLGHLGVDEKDSDDKGNDIPRTDGLKRLVEELVGQIVEIDNTIVQAPSLENGGIAAVKSRVTVLLQNGATMTYTGCADCVKSECPFPYNKFVTAIAETRAEGRVYRKLLALKNTTTFEEVIGADKEEEYSMDDNITNQQIAFIDTLANRKRGSNVNVKKACHKITGKEYNSIRKYTINEAADVVSELNKMQKEGCPEDLLGYDATWLDTFGA